MMPVRLSKFERVAGLFILVAIVGTIVSAVSAAIKQGWFEPKVSYVATFESADSLRAGATVKMAGLNAGSVDDIELLPDNRVRVTFHVLGKFQERVRRDSTAMLIRPFIIGDRVVEVTVGSEKEPILQEHAQLESEETLDIMTVMSGKKMGHMFAKMGVVLENLQTVAEAFADQGRMHSIIRIFDRMEPLLEKVDVMSIEVTKLARQATHGESLRKTLTNAALLTRELNVILPELNRQNPEMAKDLSMLVHSLGRMTSDMNKAFADVPEEQRVGAARRAVEALNEATVLMKAMQKSFLLRSNVQEVRDEEGKQRLPAQEGN